MRLRRLLSVYIAGVFSGCTLLTLYSLGIKGFDSGSPPPPLLQHAVPHPAPETALPLDVDSALRERVRALRLNRAADGAASFPSPQLDDDDDDDDANAPLSFNDPAETMDEGTLRSVERMVGAGNCIELASEGGFWCLPRWLLIGAPESGTSQLAEWLGDHDQVSASSPREQTHYFDSLPSALHRRVDLRRSKAWYMQQGGAISPDLVGEGGGWLDKTSSYLAAARPHDVARLLPNATLVVLLRDPAQRIYSGYWHRQCDAGPRVKTCKRASTESFGRMLARMRNTSWVRTAEPHKLWQLRAGQYLDSLKAWGKAFEEARVRGRMLVAFSENLRAEPASTLEGVSRFLSLQPPLGAETVKRGRPIGSLYQKPRDFKAFAEIPAELQRSARELYEPSRAELLRYVEANRRAEGAKCPTSEWLCVSVLGEPPRWLSSYYHTRVGSDD